KYLQRAKGSLEGFETKIEIVYQQFQKWISKLTMLVISQITAALVFLSFTRAGDPVSNCSSLRKVRYTKG
ncbi:unnamed protein product, partial [marine sediment metagenome]